MSEQNDETKEELERLRKKNAEILDELKKERKKNTDINIEDYNRIKDENDSLNEKLVEAQKALKTSTSDLETIKKAHESEFAYTQRLIIDNGLNDAILSSGVKPELSRAVKAMFASQATVKIDGDNRNAVIGEKSIADYVKEWASSDEGKHFVSAPINQGSGGQGGSSQGGSLKTLTRQQFDSKSPSEKVEFSKTGGRITE